MKQHSISESEEMHRADEMDCAVRRLRVVLMLPLLWIVLAKYARCDYGPAQHKVKSFNSMSDVSAILIMGAAFFTFYLPLNKKKVTRLLSAGVVLVVLCKQPVYENIRIL